MIQVDPGPCMVNCTKCRIPIGKADQFQKSQEKFTCTNCLKSCKLVQVAGWINCAKVSNGKADQLIELQDKSQN